MDELRPFFPKSAIPQEIKRLLARQAKEKALAEGTADFSKTKVKNFIRQKPVPLEIAQREWREWFATKKWRTFDFQEQAWENYLLGKLGLILAPTGSGKTYAAMGGPLMELRALGSLQSENELRIIYISPLKALVRDLETAVRRPLEELNWNFKLETRTGDTSNATRARQRKELPHILFITPESLALMITHAGWRDRFQNLKAIVLDEYHELLSTKRGSLLELTLTQIRSAAPSAKTWAVSATIENPELAVQVATGVTDREIKPIIVRSQNPRRISVESIPVSEGKTIAWFGHYGLNRVPEVAALLDESKSTLIFTNTRGQAERWHSTLLELKPEWQNKLGLHHGSLSREERERVENGVKEGTLPFVIATSSLDLGVDFPSVEQVIQIGSVKGLARAIQRAGRAFHRPNEATKLTVCPTQFLEYLEVAALKKALTTNEVESRHPLKQPLDVLVQFVLNSALAEGFDGEALLRRIRTAYSFQNLTDEEFSWILNFVTTGGSTLKAYPRYRKLVQNLDGSFHFAGPDLARLHRFNIGTIVGEQGVQVQFLNGSALGQMDEGFIGKLRKGDTFNFAGKNLQLVILKDAKAYVRLAKTKVTVPTVWGGQALPLSEILSKEIRLILDEARDSFPTNSTEASALSQAFEIQRRLSKIPALNQTLVERIKTREGHHLFIYTWQGRSVNEGLGHLLAYRLGKIAPNTIAISANDHGFECLGTNPFPEDEILKQVFRLENVAHDIEQSLNFTELAKRAFREIARISGLVQQWPTHQRGTVKHLQTSASLLFDVFREHEPNHPLLREAFQEVKRRQLELPRLQRVLGEIEKSEILIENPKRLTPFAFPLFVERIRSRVSTESLAHRIERIQKELFAA